MTDIKVGDIVTVEDTRGDKIHTHVGPAYRDSEGTLRVKNDDPYGWEPNLERDERGYFQRGVVVVSIRRCRCGYEAVNGPDLDEHVSAMMHVDDGSHHG